MSVNGFECQEKLTWREIVEILREPSNSIRTDPLTFSPPTNVGYFGALPDDRLGSAIFQVSHGFFPFTPFAF